MDAEKLADAIAQDPDLKEAPYYAVMVKPTTIGSMGGLVIDTDARVLKRGRRPHPGLYATGESRQRRLLQRGVSRLRLVPVPGHDLRPRGRQERCGVCQVSEGTEVCEAAPVGAAPAAVDGGGGDTIGAR